MLDDAAWVALTAVLTVLGALWTVRQGRRHGSAAAVRGVAITLLPAAALFTGTLRLGTRIVDAVVDWATALVFNPLLWFGVGLAGLSVVLFGVSGAMAARRPSEPDPKAGTKPVGRKKKRDALPPSSPPSTGPVLDDDLADIEAILKKRGIT
jgi:hypothetical protein